MILVDSSVWIDYFRGTSTRESDELDRLLGTEPVATGDLTLIEVLQGFRAERNFYRARKLLTSLEVVALVGSGHRHQGHEKFQDIARRRHHCAQDHRYHHCNPLH